MSRHIGDEHFYASMFGFDSNEAEQDGDDWGQFVDIEEVSFHDGDGSESEEEMDSYEARFEKQTTRRTDRVLDFGRLARGGHPVREESDPVAQQENQSNRANTLPQENHAPVDWEGYRAKLSSNVCQWKLPSNGFVVEEKHASDDYEDSKPTANNNKAKTVSILYSKRPKNRPTLRYPRCLTQRRRPHEVAPLSQPCTPPPSPSSPCFGRNNKTNFSFFEMEDNKSPRANLRDRLVQFLVGLHPKATQDPAVAKRLAKQFEQAPVEKRHVVLTAAVKAAKQQNRSDLLHLIGDMSVDALVAFDR